MKNNINITKHNFKITKLKRSLKLNQKPMLIWFTGLSGSGKSTLSNIIEESLFNQGYMTYSLDGDNIRYGLCNNLKFGSEDRKENIRRIAEVANLFLDAGIIVCASFVSPFQKDRDMVKSIIGEENYIEIFVSTSLEECEKRDVKGLYAKARAGLISDFTGISSKYETPHNSDYVIDTSKKNIDSCVKEIMKFLKNKYLNGKL
jgi:adenylylsulfate kinase